ncbi:hypothetical protein Daura_29555 [Dactylosporangium aurantiacum]|uniref:Secreted protein n=1 Tax=Dactylosporangium aurantiacum TaxID=35754 RepID=A0A9Q9IE91_9ACTN|nr:hypothetical protein [Dactylosporangium aurantiacum]MDG6106799.1 hypothetical protein [Dactylosporangium aurantiacum]UWZ50940.1 hypothetical protein Daura_29555 [Dactylosporangium aurantiacum]
MNNLQTRSVFGVAIAAAVLVQLAACAGDPGPPGRRGGSPAGIAPALAGPGVDAPTVGAATGTPAANATTTAGADPVVGAGNVSPPPPAQLPPTELPRPDPSDQACTPAVLLAHVRAEPERPPSGFEDVRIYNCAHGFARIYAAPNPVPGQLVQGDQFFLQRAGDGWKTIARGLDTECGDGRPELTAACASFA